MSNTKAELMFVTTVPNGEYTCQHVDGLSHVSQHAACHRAAWALQVWSSWQEALDCFLWSLVLTRLLSSLQKLVLVEGTAHTMNTAETLLQCLDVFVRPRPAKMRQGHWLKSMLTPCCHKQNTFP